MSENIIDFQELNASQTTPHESRLHIGIHNAFSEFTIEGVEKIKNVLTEKVPSAKISLIDLTGFFRQAESLHLFLLAFPKIRLFLPHESRTKAEALNLFFRDSHSNLICLLSGDLQIEEFEFETFDLEMTKGNLLALVPEVKVHGHLLDSGYLLEKTSKRFELRIKKLAVGEPTLAPYRLTGIFDREKWLGLGGLDRLFTDPLLLILDLCYRGYGMDMVIRRVLDFSVSLKDSKRLSPEEKNKFDQGFVLFLRKNLPHSLQQSLLDFILALVSFNFKLLINLLVVLKKNRALRKSQLLSHHDITQRFDF